MRRFAWGESFLRYGVERGASMTERGITGRGMTTSVLTDMQFWVPVVVLVAGLVLLGAIR